MEIKLKSVFRELRSPSTLKAFLFGVLLLFGAGGGEFRALPAFVFAAGAIGLYLFPLFRTARLLPSFAVLTAASALLSIRFGDTPLHVPLVVVATCACYVLLRLKNLTFVFRARWHHLFVLMTAYLVFVSALPSLAAPFGTIRFAGIFGALAILIAQLLGEQAGYTSRSRRREQTFALTVSFVVAEILWATTVLPLGILNAASIGIVILFAGTMLILSHSEASLNRQTALKIAAFLGALIVIILLTTRWAIQ